MKWFFAIFFAFSFVFLSIFGISCVYGYLFPVKYSEEIETACLEYEVEETIIYSVINTESHFNQNAISSKGAIGLMQIMPSTADWLQEELGLNSIDLYDPEDNITLGTYYLSTLIERYKNLETALCAYNAGPTNVSAWLKNENYSDDGKTLKNIPFEETRRYIEKFNQNRKYYNQKLANS